MAGTRNATPSTGNKSEIATANERTERQSRAGPHTGYIKSRVTNFGVAISTPYFNRMYKFQVPKC